jgi:hypothetical protein
MTEFGRMYYVDAKLVEGLSMEPFIRQVAKQQTGEGSPDFIRFDYNDVIPYGVEKYGVREDQVHRAYDLAAKRGEDDTSNGLIDCELGDG